MEVEEEINPNKYIHSIEIMLGCINHYCSTTPNHGLDLSPFYERYKLIKLYNDDNEINNLYNQLQSLWANILKN